MDRMALLHYRKRNQFGNLYNSHTNSSNGTIANFSFFIFYFTLILRVANNAGGFFCGGTLIHENYVLTGLFVCFIVVTSLTRTFVHWLKYDRRSMFFSFFSRSLCAWSVNSIRPRVWHWFRKNWWAWSTNRSALWKGEKCILSALLYLFESLSETFQFFIKLISILFGWRTPVLMRKAFRLIKSLFMKTIILHWAHMQMTLRWFVWKKLYKSMIL